MKKIKEGIYVSENGEDLQVDIPEVLNALGYEDTPDNRRMCTDVIVNELKKKYPDADGIVLASGRPDLHHAPSQKQ